MILSTEHPTYEQQRFPRITYVSCYRIRPPRNLQHTVIVRTYRQRSIRSVLLRPSLRGDSGIALN